jgi:hypothetical protein
MFFESQVVKITLSEMQPMWLVSSRSAERQAFTENRG